MSPRPIVRQVVAAFVPRRAITANKGDAGRVLIVAGSRGMAGAAALAAMGAVRGGAGLVKVATPRSAWDTVARLGPREATTAGLPDAKGALSSSALPSVRKLIGEFCPHVIVVGPGLGRGAGAQRVCHGLFAGWTGPLVIDADALGALAASPVEQAGPRVITPHEGEMARLLGCSVGRVRAGRAAAARAASRRYGAVAVLKGAGTLVTDGGTLFRNTAGNPGLATGGTGDVLAGLIAALWAPRRNLRGAALGAAALGVFVHGAAGDLTARRVGSPGMRATDVAEDIPAALRRVAR